MNENRNEINLNVNDEDMMNQIPNNYPFISMFKVNITNGFDTVSFETNDIGYVFEYSDLLKQHLQSLHKYVGKVNPNNDEPKEPVIIDPPTEKQVAFLRRHGIDEENINSMTKEIAKSIIKEILNNQNK